jgi:hypothetical protein
MDTPPVASQQDPAPAGFTPPAGAPRAAPVRRDLDARQLVRFLYTHNPFYILSAALVFWGLRSSFETDGQTFETLALMVGLFGYTLLLAATTFLVIRYGRIWQDGRSQLLLIVLLFLAISVTFDDALPRNPPLGVLCQVCGLVFSIMLSEVLLHGLRLRLRAWYRIPYYLTLGLSFLAPVALFQLLSDPADSRGQWGLFLVPTVAGICWLTLLPAIHREPAYAEDNGTPWHWPLFPWSLFLLLGLGVCQRSYYLCVSMHYLGGTETIFAPYFLVPFVLVIGLLLLEMGRSTGSPRATVAAMFVPVVLVGLAAVPAQGPIATGFQALFRQTLGADPLFLTVLASLAFYAYAWWRRVPGASDVLSLAMVVLIFVSPDSRRLLPLATAQGDPLLIAAVIQGVVCLRRAHSFRFLLSLLATIGAIAIDGLGTILTAYDFAIPLHLALASVLFAGLVFRDEFAEALRYIGALLLLIAGLNSLRLTPSSIPGLPEVWLLVYPLLLAAVAAVYGYLAHNQFHYVVAGLLPGIWLLLRGWAGYLWLRHLLPGLNFIAWGLISLAVAVWISLLKMGLPQRWFASKRPADGSRPADPAMEANPQGPSPNVDRSTNDGIA